MTAALRVAEREVRFFRTAWRATVFSAFVAPLLYLLALGTGLGGLIDDTSGFGGATYAQFIAPGLMVGSVVQIAANAGLWPVMAGHRWIGFHRAAVSTPVSAPDVATGWLVWVAGRAAAQSAIFLVIAAVLGAIGSPAAVLSIVIAALTAVAFTAPLMAYTASVDSDQAFDPIMRVLVTPLFLFSGTFFPVSSLPMVLQWVVGVFPLWHGTELARTVSTGVDSPLHPVVHLAVVLVWVGAGWLVARRAFVRRLTP
ncbi:MAG: ABC transporter permease [Actinomycetota bacterium]